VNESLVTIESESGRHRARVERVSEGVFRVEVEQRVAAVDAGGVTRGEFWSALRDSTAYTDSAERATELAGERPRSAEASVP
jgi:hypothetical protein